MPNWRIKPLQYQQGERLVARPFYSCAGGRISECTGLTVHRCVALLHAQVVAAAKQSTILVKERRTNWDAALCKAEMCLGNGHL